MHRRMRQCLLWFFWYSARLLNRKPLLPALSNNRYRNRKHRSSAAKRRVTWLVIAIKALDRRIIVMLCLEFLKWIHFSRPISLKWKKSIFLSSFRQRKLAFGECSLYGAIIDIFGLKKKYFRICEMSCYYDCLQTKKKNSGFIFTYLILYSEYIYIYL